MSQALKYKLGGFAITPGWSSNGVALLQYGQLENPVFSPLDYRQGESLEVTRWRSAPISRPTADPTVLVRLSVCGRILESWYQPEISFRVMDGDRVLVSMKSPAGFPDGTPAASTPSTKGTPLWPTAGYTPHGVATAQAVAVPPSDDAGHGTDDASLRVLYSIHYPYPGILWLQAETTYDPGPPPRYIPRAPYYDYGPAGFSSLTLFEWSAVMVEFIAP